MNPKRRFFLGLTIFSSKLMMGCEGDIEGPNSLREPFSIYGIINPHRPIQSILVSPIENLLHPLGVSIDAEVRSTDLATGAEYLWKDSVVTNATGQLDHIFSSDFRPDFGSRHHIEVVRSDGEVSMVEARVPMPVTIEPEDTDTGSLDVIVRGEDLRLVRIDVIYGVRSFAANRGSDSPGPYSTYAFSHTGEEVKKEGGWRLRINLDTDHDKIRSLYYFEYWNHEDFTGFNNPMCDGLGLFDMKISLTVGSEDWDPPGGVFDPDVLAQPGTLSNVQNGFGFVAGGYDDEAYLYPSTRTLDDTWFFDFILDREPEISGCGN